MTSIFDFVTVAFFLGLICAFFFLTDGSPKTLIHFVFAAVVLAVADQVGNAGLNILAWIMIAAAAGYAAIIVRADT